MSLLYNMISLLMVLLLALDVVDASNCRPSYGSMLTVASTTLLTSTPSSNLAKTSLSSQTTQSLSLNTRDSTSSDSVWTFLTEAPTILSSSTVTLDSSTLSSSSSSSVYTDETTSSSSTEAPGLETSLTDTSSATSFTNTSIISSTDSSATATETDSSPSSTEASTTTSESSSTTAIETTTESSSSSTGTSTASTTSSSSSSSSSTSSSSTLDPIPSSTGIPFTCPPEGFITTQGQIATYSLTTGSITFIARVQSPTNENIEINAVGYNTADNYMYLSVNSGPGHVARLYSDGHTEYLLDLTPGQTGDVDDNGYYWLLSTISQEIYQVDIDRNRPGTYATVVSTTSLATSGLGSAIIFDWAFVPGAGQYLWAVGTAGGGDPTTVVLRFSMETLKFETFARYDNIATDGGLSEHFAVGDGSLYVLDDKTGDLYKFYITEMGRAPEPVFQRGPGFPTASSDGARCASNPNISPLADQGGVQDRSG